MSRTILAILSILGVVMASTLILGGYGALISCVAFAALMAENNPNDSTERPND